MSSRGFDCLAPHYRWMEWFLAGTKLQKCRIEFLPEISDARKVLLLGEGHGRFLCNLLRTNPSAEITCLDGSAKMLAQARGALRRSGLDTNAVKFVHADVFDCDWAVGPYDVVASHFFLDCFPLAQQRQLIATIGRKLAPGGAWLLADFRQPERGFQRWRAAVILKAMYVFFGAVTGLPARQLVHPDAFLHQNGFRLVRRRVSEWGLLHSDLWRKVENPAPVRHSDLALAMSEQS